MLRVPVASVVIVSCALQVNPPASAHVTAPPMLLTPSLNCTVPPGVRPEPSVGVTVAVKVIASPWNAGLSDETSAVDVLNRSPVVVTVLVSTLVKFDPDTVACVEYCANGGASTVTLNTTLTVLPAGIVPRSASTVEPDAYSVPAK